MSRRGIHGLLILVGTLGLGLLPSHSSRADELTIVGDVEGQPLGANVARLCTAMEALGHALPPQTLTMIEEAIQERNAKSLQRLIDPLVMAQVHLNPEVRVKVIQGPFVPKLQQGGYTPVILKVVNDSTVTRQLNVSSPQAGPVYSGAALAILARQAQTELLDQAIDGDATGRFIDLEVFRSPPMTKNLSGLEVEYVIALIYSQEAGKRDVTFEFDVGQGTQDIGFRGEIPILFDIQPAIPVTFEIQDETGSPTVARLEIRDRWGHVFPPQAKRLAPDFFFQPQIYRRSGDTVLLPPGEFSVSYSRGPEYLVQQTKLVVTAEANSQTKGGVKVPLKLKRWVAPMEAGFYCGDHHIHGAGCSHYESPTLGVKPEDMFAQVKGEGLNVGCVLTWGPCFEFQRQFFSPDADRLSEPMTVLKYDLEISGFGSAALGHVCLLNLKDQTYPGSKGGKVEGWPTWTVPVMRWCKEQGGVTGYPHSAMHINPQASAERVRARFDRDGDGLLSEQEVATALLPDRFGRIDLDGDGRLSQRELIQRFDQAADELPNFAVPEMNGAGAMEIFVSVAEGVCDFISAMDTARISEWNTWYHLMNCGFPLKVSGETDFPCMSSRRVGQGRVYVQLGEVDRVDFSAWCEGLGAGRSYVSDGYAHALDFEVQGKKPGTQDVQLDGAGKVTVAAKVAFASEIPKAVAYGQLMPREGRRWVGDTIELHAPRSTEMVSGGERTVEIVVGGEIVAQQVVPADGNTHELTFEIDVARSTWVALRQFPQLHTNPVNVIVEGKPIRISRRSAKWCIDSIELLWDNRHRVISESERAAAREAYDRALEIYRKIYDECPPGS